MSEQKNEEKIYRCPICDLTFIDNKMARDHLWNPVYDFLPTCSGKKVHNYTKEKSDRKN